jgi:hypothetical protein
LARGTIIEYKPFALDKMRSIQVTSKIDLSALDYLQGAPDTVYPSVRNYSFPDTLTAVTYYYWWATVSGDQADTAYDVAFDIRITQGYRGPCNAYITERYTSNPAAPGFLAGVGGIYKFNPVAVSFPVVYGSSPPPRAFAKTITIPATIHAAITPTANASGGSSVSPGGLPTIAATTPTAIPAAGTLLLVDLEMERWRFGLWVQRSIQIEVPA